jgi:prepilin-type N-terminal cleavage/methylation domain-containing protein
LPFTRESARNALVRGNDWGRKEMMTRRILACAMLLPLLRNSMRTGFSLFEVLLCLALSAVCVAIALPPYAALRDRLAVHGATSSLVRALNDARSVALRLSERHAIRADTASATLLVHSVGDTVSVVPLGILFGVQLQATRDSIAYTGTGLGYGAANVTYVVQRGASAETVTVSRAGRVSR